MWGKEKGSKGIHVVLGKDVRTEGKGGRYKRKR